jgi:RNA polymerase sigma-70 factor (ECF subfamily)
MSEQRPAGENQGANVLGAFQLHRLSLKRFIGRYLNNAQDIEDVSQEAFLRAFKAEKTTKVLQPKSFLFRIAKNVAISQLRSKSRQITDYIEDQPSADVLLSEWSTEDEVMAQQKLGIHCEAVAALPPKCRRVYLMRKVYGMPHKEIAERLGIATSTVEKHLLKGVEACDRFIRERNQEPYTAPQPLHHRGQQ